MMGRFLFCTKSVIQIKMVEFRNDTELQEDLNTWKIFIEIMQDEYYTIKNEIYKLINNKKLNEVTLKHLELLQTTILENERKLENYKKSFMDHTVIIGKTHIPPDGVRHQLHIDEENIKQSLIQLKKSFSEFISLIHKQTSIE